MSPHRSIRLLLLASLIAGCSAAPKFFNEYKIDVQQGNVLTQEMVAQLRPGLTREQVRFVLGTPILMDMFHANRWDYTYRLQKGRDGEAEMRKFTVFFDANGRLARVAGDVAPRAESGKTVVAENKMRELDLGSVTADAVAAPIEERGGFGGFLEAIGF